MVFKIIKKTTLFSFFIFCTLAVSAKTVPVRDINVHRVGKALVYTVQRGDSLYTIAFQYEKDYLELAKINNLKPPYTVYTGQKIRLTSSKVTLEKLHSTVKKKKTVAASSHFIEKKAVLRIHKAVCHKHLIRKTTHSSSRTKKKSMKGVYAPVRHWRWPIRGRIVNGFTARNKGIDISGHYHEIVHAAANGKVVYAGNGIKGYGYLVIIKHNAYYLTAYGHNDSLLVKTGYWVKVGQSIAKLGVTPTGRIRLHFEMRYKGKPINPRRYL